MQNKKILSNSQYSYLQLSFNYWPKYRISDPQNDSSNRSVKNLNQEQFSKMKQKLIKTLTDPHSKQPVMIGAQSNLQKANMNGNTNTNTNKKRLELSESLNETII